ncbi:hypothetical protein C1N61_26260 (plasmid) [Priestia aryabhattai]
MKKIKVSKKAAGLVLAGTIVVSSMGTTAYAAYGDQWNALITKGVDKLYTAVFPEIKQKADEKEAAIIDQISNDVSRNVKSISEDVKKHKEQLIQRNEKELDSYYSQTISNLETTANTASKVKKDELTRKADQELNEAKRNIDAKIQAELVNVTK